MTDEELAAIEARAKGVPYSGIPVTPDETVALVAEVRRLHGELERLTAVKVVGYDHVPRNT